MPPPPPPADLNSGEGTSPSSMDTPVDALIGLLVDGRYRIERRLARGGMATVYIAHDERLDRPVALKVMHPHLAESADFVARFRREARSAARIVHPGVVSVFDQGVVHGQGFLVMELIEGPNLRTLLYSQGAFTIDQALRYAQEVLDALGAAHRVGVIHRDIKPENVLVPTDGPVRVTDFGLARAASEVSMSTMGSMLGTVAYMAPEIATTGLTDARTDIYSVGIMVYEMLVGHVPWEGEVPMQMAYSHVHSDIPAPSEEQEWLPREVDDLVAALAAREPAERPADAREALELVARARASIPANLAARRADVVRASTGADSGIPTAPMHFEGMTSQLPAVLPMNSQMIVHTSGSTERPDEEPKSRRKAVFTFVAVLVVLLISGSTGGWWWWTQYGPGSYIEMPVTDGRSAVAVQSDLTALNLNFEVIEAFSDDVPAGSVISSDPPSQGSAHKDAEVTLKVSKGIDMRVVPDLSGATQESAEGRLTAAGLALGTVSEAWSETVPEGRIISQGSEIGASVPHSSPIDIVLSKGREPLTVPDLSGQDAERALALVAAVEMVPVVTEAFSDSVPQGKVISQSTAAGSTQHRGDSVVYVVSKGPELVAVPQVTGKQLGEAERILKEAGLEVEVERLIGGFFNTVRLVSPEEGEMVPKGTIIKLTVV